MAPTDTYPIALNVTELMQTPPGMVQAGDEFRVTDADAAPDLIPHAECDRCGTVFESPIPEHVSIDAHRCTDGYRAHPENEDITVFDR